MKYVKTTKATDWPKNDPIGVKFIRTLLFFIPVPNRKNEKKFHLLNEWLIEFDEEGYPYREIGIDKSGEPIFAVAAGDDEYGFWMDTNMKFEDFLDNESCVIDRGIFNQMWEKVRPPIN